MRHLRHLAASLAMIAPTIALAGEEIGLPRGMTATELEWAAKNPAAGFKALTAPPTGPLVATTEYSPSQAILFGYSGTTSWKNIIAQMAKHITTTANTETWVIVTSSSQLTDMTNRFNTNGVNMSKVRTFTLPLNSIWARDYGPRFIHEGGCRVIVDSTYYSTRPSDDAIPSALASQLKMPYYATDLYHSGGNYHIAEGGTGYCTRLVVNDNPSKTETQIKDTFKAYYGLLSQIWTQFPFSVDGTGHVDMWFIPVGPTSVIISDWPLNSGSTQDVICDATAADMSARGWTVTRVPAFLVGGVHYTYTNATICNNVVMIPSYTNATVASSNATALAAWQAAMPGKTVVAVPCENIISAAGAMHCIMMQVPTSTGGNNPVTYVKNLNTAQSFNPGATVAVNWISDHIRTISAVDVQLSTDGGATFATIAANEANDGAFTWTVPDLYTTQARIRVLAKDALGNTGGDMNDADLTINGTQQRTGDLDGDGFITGGDIALLLLDAGPCADAANCPADLDFDGVVGASDLSLMLLLFGDPV
ncbi:MAG: agmatine deiminase family protein [Planctomycetota bacterium]